MEVPVVVALAVLLVSAVIATQLSHPFLRMMAILSIILWFLGAVLYNADLNAVEWWSVALLFCAVSCSFLGLSPLYTLFHSPLIADYSDMIGAKVLYNPVKKGVEIERIEADIFAIHGLGSNPDQAWVDKKSSKNWLSDFLPLEFPNMRVIAVNHDSRWDYNSSHMSIQDFGESILESICSVRLVDQGIQSANFSISTKEKRRPIIIIGYSFGGVLLKKALTMARHSIKSDWLAVANSIRGIIFLGTPHRGSPLAPLGHFKTFLSYWHGSRTQLMDYMNPGTIDHEEMHRTFIIQYGTSAHIHCFFETKPVNFGYVVVPKSSATIDGHSNAIVQRNHWQLNKFSRMDDAVLKDIYRAIRKASKFQHGQFNAEELTNMVPFPRNRNFVPREDICSELDRRLLMPDQNYQAVAVLGLGGCGKTQIAIEYAYHYQRTTSCSVFWVHASNAANFAESYSQIALIAKLSPELKRAEQWKAVKGWLEKQSNWMLVLDNADEVEIFQSAAENNATQTEDSELLRFIPKKGHGKWGGRVVWTTRDKGILGALVDVNCGVEVCKMNTQDSFKLFRILGGFPVAEMPSDDEEELLKSLHGLPLAIAQAAAFIRKTEISVQHYLTLFNESEERQSKLLDNKFGDLHRVGVPNSVMRTWLVSMEHLFRESPCAEMLLNTIVFLDNQAISLQLLKAVANPAFNEVDVLLTVSRLAEYSFLSQTKADERGPTYEQHRLVQLAARNLLETEPEKYEKYFGKALSVLFMLLKPAKFGEWDWLLPHIHRSLLCVPPHMAENLVEVQEAIFMLTQWMAENDTAGTADPPAQTSKQPPELEDCA